MIKRREFIAALGGAVAWPLAARAQQPSAKTPQIGIIDDSPRWNVFRQALRDLEGQNIAFDYAYGNGVPERLAEAAAQLVRRPVDVIVTYGTAATFAAKQATTTIPIVMISVRRSFSEPARWQRNYPRCEVERIYDLKPDPVSSKLRQQNRSSMRLV